MTSPRGESLVLDAQRQGGFGGGGGGGDIMLFRGSLKVYDPLTNCLK